MISRFLLPNTVRGDNKNSVTLKVVVLVFDAPSQSLLSIINISGRVLETDR